MGKQYVLPTNVIHLPTSCSNTGHPAPFTVELAEFFIKLFTSSGDIVLDPFLGSGTTALAALKLGRRFIGIEAVLEYGRLAAERISSSFPLFFQDKRLLKIYQPG